MDATAQCTEELVKHSVFHNKGVGGLTVSPELMSVIMPVDKQAGLWSGKPINGFAKKGRLNKLNNNEGFTF